MLHMYNDHLGIRPQQSDINDRPGNKHGDDDRGFQKGLYKSARISGRTANPSAFP